MQNRNVMFERTISGLFFGFAFSLSTSFTLCLWLCLYAPGLKGMNVSEKIVQIVPFFIRCLILGISTGVSIGMYAGFNSTL